MLRHSISFLTSSRKVSLIIRRVSNQAKSSVVNHEPREKIKTNDTEKDTIRNRAKLSYNSVLTRYNEIVGFTEIDEAYNKVTVLQVRAHVQLMKFFL